MSIAANLLIQLLDLWTGQRRNPSSERHRRDSHLQHRPHDQSRARRRVRVNHCTDHFHHQRDRSQPELANRDAFVDISRYLVGRDSVRRVAQPWRGGSGVPSLPRTFTTGSSDCFAWHFIYSLSRLARLARLSGILCARRTSQRARP